MSISDTEIAFIRESIRVGGLECVGYEHWIQNNNAELRLFDQMAKEYRAATRPASSTAAKGDV